MFFFGFWNKDCIIFPNNCFYSFRNKHGDGGNSPAVFSNLSTQKATTLETEIKGGSELNTGCGCHSVALFLPDISLPKEKQHVLNMTFLSVDKMD